MIDITLENNRIFYEKYESCLEFLSNINYDEYEYPNEKVKFHVYTEVRTDKELEAIKYMIAMLWKKGCQIRIYLFAQ